MTYVLALRNRREINLHLRHGQYIRWSRHIHEEICSSRKNQHILPISSQLASKLPHSTQCTPSQPPQCKSRPLYPYCSQHTLNRSLRPHSRQGAHRPHHEVLEQNIITPTRFRLIMAKIRDLGALFGTTRATERALERTWSVDIRGCGSSLDRSRRAETAQAREVRSRDAAQEGAGWGCERRHCCDGDGGEWVDVVKLAMIEVLRWGSVTKKLGGLDWLAGIAWKCDFTSSLTCRPRAQQQQQILA